MQGTNNYLFLYLKTGGGHLAPAKAVSNWIREKNDAQVDIELHDGFWGSPRLIKWIVEDGYSFSQARGKWMFELIYAVNKVKFIARLTSWLVCFFIVSALEKKILRDPPSKIIVFHFLLIKPILSIVRKNKLNVPVITVVTDPFTAHPIWFLEPNQHFVIFSNKLKNYMLDKKGIKEQNISVFPFTINPRFSGPASVQQQLAFRCHLGIDPYTKIILMMGGADGIPKGEKLLKIFAQTKIDADVIIVCGRNKSLHRKAHSIKQRYGFNRLHILGFVDHVYELLSISEVVITKCGASTFMEVLLCGKVPLVNSYIWEQEKGNVDFIKQNGMGIFEPNIKKIAELARLLVTDSDFKQSFRQNIERMGLQNGTPYVSEFISNYNSLRNEPTGNFRLTY